MGKQSKPNGHWLTRTWA